MKINMVVCEKTDGQMDYRPTLNRAGKGDGVIKN